ncbi:MAG: HD domain-containing protein [Candidatus Saccharimonadales bacterium]
MSERIHSIEIRSNQDLVEDVVTFEPEACLGLIDDLTQTIYLPFRGTTSNTERAILPAEPCVEHRENDAEHTFHIATVVNQLWQQRQQLEIIFPDDYDPLLALSYTLDHDVLEIHAGDVDSMTRDPVLKQFKRSNEKAAAAIIRLAHPSLAPIADNSEQYEKKDNSTARFVNDLDKIAPIRVICADGGRRWHNWQGTATSRKFMVETVRKKLLTPFGHVMLDAIEEDLAAHPEYFPDECNYQGRLF